MFDKEEILVFLKKNLKEKRLSHVMGVVNVAKKLARIYKEDEEKIEIAALIHDCAKNFTFMENLKILRDSDVEIDEITLLNEELIHGLAATVIAKDKFNIYDEEILNAVRYHTTGRKNSSVFEKIIYIADAIEPSRQQPRVEKMREKAFGGDLDKAILISIDGTIEFLVEKGMLIHNDTIDMRNSLIMLKGEGNEEEKK